MPLLSINQVRYFVESQGDGTPLVLLHGFTGRSVSWAAQTAVFAPHFRTTTIDLLGHGRTAAPPGPNRYLMEQAAADIIAILERMKAEGGDLRVGGVGCRV